MGAAQADLSFAGLADPDADEISFWNRFERRVRERCDPLSRILGRRNITHPLQISDSQLSRELSGAEDKSLALKTAVLLARRSQDEELNRIIVVEGLGCLMPQRARQLSPVEELKLLKETLHRHGRVGQLMLEEALGQRGSR